MSRRSRTTLYEALRAPAPGQTVAPSGGAIGSNPLARHELPKRIGAGAIATVALACVVVSAAAFLIGYSQGRAVGFAEGSGLESGSGPFHEPLQPPVLPAHVPERVGASNGSTFTPDPSPGGGADPRFPGLNYFVLAQVEPERAPKMVQFLREEGLEAYAQKWDNGRFLQVFVLPGFAGGDLKSAEAEMLKKGILAAGRRWKSLASGNEDFRSHYPRKYLGD